jgi:hypothetical protein
MTLRPVVADIATFQSARRLVFSAKPFTRESARKKSVRQFTSSGPVGAETVYDY